MSDSDDSEAFSLKWKHFHSNLISGFHELFLEEQFVDVTLTTEGKFIKAHKVVLSVCSPFFRRIFQSNPCKHPVVILSISFRNLQDILTFVYQGEVNVRQENLSGFLKAAELLQIKGLTSDECEDESDSKKSQPVTKDFRNKTQNNPKAHQIKPKTINSETETITTSSIKKRRTSPLYTIDTDYKRQPLSNSFDTGFHIKTEFTDKINPKSTSESQSILAATLSQNRDGSNYKINSKSISESQSIFAATLSQNSSNWSHNSLVNSMINSDQYEVSNELPEVDMENDFNSTQSFDNNGYLDQTTFLPHMDRENGKQDPKKSIYQCDTCFKRFTRRDHLKTHHKNIHGEDKGPFTCHICSQLYKNSESLRKHVSKFHSTVTLEDYCKVNRLLTADFINSSLKTPLKLLT